MKQCLKSFKFEVTTWPLTSLWHYFKFWWVASSLSMFYKFQRIILAKYYQSMPPIFFPRTFFRFGWQTSTLIVYKRKVLAFTKIDTEIFVIPFFVLNKFCVQTSSVKLIDLFRMLLIPQVSREKLFFCYLVISSNIKIV